MLSTMQDAPLLVSGIMRHGQQVYGDSQVITITGPAGEYAIPGPSNNHPRAFAAPLHEPRLEAVQRWPSIPWQAKYVVSPWVDAAG